MCHDKKVPGPEQMEFRVGIWYLREGSKDAWAKYGRCRSRDAVEEPTGDFIACVCGREVSRGRMISSDRSCSASDILLPSFVSPVNGTAVDD